MHYPLITVTIPSYNHAKFILSALNSVLAEDYPNKEIVIIDDGSTDGSAAIIQQWVDANKDNIPVTYLSRANKGLAFTINELIAIANGEYIAWLASDDVFCNNGFTKRIKALQGTNKMVAIGDCIVIDDNGVTTHRSWMKDVMKRDVNQYKTDEGIMKEILQNPAISGSVLLIKKEVYKKIGNYLQNFYAEDIYFYQRCAAKKYIVYIDEVVSEYRRHDTNASGSDLSKGKRIIKSIIKSYWMNWRLFPGLYMKGLALKQLLKWKYSYFRTYVISKKYNN